MKKLSNSKAVLESLNKIGIYTFEDVLNHLPYRYEDFSYTPEKAVLENRERVVLYGHLSSSVKVVRFSHRNCAKFNFLCPDGRYFAVEAWNRAFLHQSLKTSESYTLSGVYDKKRNVLQLTHIFKGQLAPEEAYRPVYHLPARIGQKAFSNLVKRALNEVPTLDDIVPESLRLKYRLLNRYDAVKKLHFPTSKEDIRQANRALKYEEALLFELRCHLIKKENQGLYKKKNTPIDIQELKKFIHSLTYSLTRDQKYALKDVLEDLNKPTAMYRLLQGDVGCGKTLVAALSCYANYLRGQQSAFMVPTDTLARQHYDNLKDLFKSTPVEVALLTGGLSSSARRDILERLYEGQIDILVGTHALFSKDVDYAYLGLCVIDEQHKFGVNQRRRLMGKGEDTDLLLMSATPIPRTLTLTLFGDLDISTIKEFPGGAREVETHLVKPKDSEVQTAIKEALSHGKRVYIVAPEIEEDETASFNSVKKLKRLYDSLYPNKVALLHGKMDSESKEVALLAFKTGLCPILIATSLIEVGIDVKEASLMMVYEPTHFSLSTLHQLRGRIGRDGSKADFYLLSEDKEEDLEKLQPLLETLDGFKIAEADLKMRGPGDVSGVRQSGLPEFSVADIIADFRVFEAARDDVKLIMNEPQKIENQALLEKAKEDIDHTSLA